MKTRVVTRHRDAGAVVHWLITNVGEVAAANPYIYWRGQGWNMRSWHVAYPANPEYNDHGWSIEFDREEDAVLFKLRWS